MLLRGMLGDGGGSVKCWFLIDEQHCVLWEQESCYLKSLRVSGGSRYCEIEYSMRGLRVGVLVAASSSGEAEIEESFAPRSFLPWPLGQICLTLSFSISRGKISRRSKGCIQFIELWKERCC
jgi:hypothetical protein